MCEVKYKCTYMYIYISIRKDHLHPIIFKKIIVLIRLYRAEVNLSSGIGCKAIWFFYQIPKVFFSVFMLHMRFKGGPQYITDKETLTAFSGSQPGPLFLCRIGEFISSRIVLLNSWYH